MKPLPFCPNKECRNYSGPVGLWYSRYGAYYSKRCGTVLRFRCKCCGRTFSANTFSLNYYVHKTLSYRKILEHLHTGSGVRDLARSLKVSCGTVSNRIARMARQSMAVMTSLSSELTLQENLVADGFESFVKSQYMPNNITILVGQNSQFLYLADYAQLTRKGRMTDAQKEKNVKIRNAVNIGRATIYSSFENIVRTSLDWKRRAGLPSLALYTDEHPRYKEVMHQLSPEERIELRHVRVNSRLARTVLNPLFSVNYYDRELRKDNSDHTRETVQFARNVGNMMDRFEVYRLYHNFLKPFRINRKAGEEPTTHGQMAGLSLEKIEKELRTVFTRRRFLGKLGNLNLFDRKHWCRCLQTPMSPHADYLPAYVLA